MRGRFTSMCTVIQRHTHQHTAHAQCNSYKYIHTINSNTTPLLTMCLISLAMHQRRAAFNACTMHASSTIDTRILHTEMSEGQMRTALHHAIHEHTSNIYALELPTPRYSLYPHRCSSVLANCATYTLHIVLVSSQCDQVI